MTDSQPRDLRSLPKAHLHVHLEGAMRRTTLTELADRHGLPANLQGDGSFASFIALYRAACEALRSPEDLSRLVHEVVEDAAADGAIWIEISAWVSSAHAQRLGMRDQVEVLDALLDAGRWAERKSGIGVGFIVSCNRTRPSGRSRRTGQLAAKHAGDGVVALGLADDEMRGAAELFGEHLRSRATPGRSVPRTPANTAARTACGLPRRPRCAADRTRRAIGRRSGPAAPPGSTGVTLDVCPTSNVVLRVVPTLADHPLPRLLEAGVPLGLNADDPLFFGSGILAEF